MPDGGVSAEISNAVVHLISEYMGRGPMKARTYIHDGLVTVVLRDLLTKGERHLAATNAELVLTTRRAVQAAMEDDLVALVERHTGRTVAAFLSQHHLDPDIAIESFVLAPE